ncbi:MAG TPA: hypothetical protein VNS55_08470 [Nocardioides sp.]|nr:hypothetical protein [Nocardioides sp.]
MTGDPLTGLAGPDHEHAWRLVSVENEDGGVHVSERLCATCAAVQIDGA